MRDRFVLIDDDVDELDFLQSSLLSLGFSHTCVPFTCPEKALTELSADLGVVPTYIIMDFNMPRLRGDYLLKELRQLRELDETVIVVMSTSMPFEVSWRLKEIGADYAFEKPCSTADYHKLLAGVISPTRDRVRGLEQQTACCAVQSALN